MAVPAEHLHLEHVLQTVGVLESVILRSFGPEGGQVLFTRDTGQAMLTRSGTRILTALRLENPLARMVVECVLKHSTVTGDGSKTFILLLASLLRMIQSTACRDPTVSHTYNSRKAAESATARHLADKLLVFALEELDDIICTGVVPHGYSLQWQDFAVNKQLPAHTNNHCVRKLLASFYLTRLGHSHCGFISDLTCELLTQWKLENDRPSISLQFIIDNLPALQTPVSGFPITCSRFIEGQIIHRDFATPCPQTDRQPVRAVVFTGYLQPKLLSAGELLELGSPAQGMKERSIMQFNACSERSLKSVIANLQSLGVTLILSAVKQSAAVLALATQAEMGIVECVSEDELSLFNQLSGATPVSDSWNIDADHIATLTFCRPILLGAHRYVHVAFHYSVERVTDKPCSLIICGPGEAQTDQYASAFRDAILMLLSTWEPIIKTATSASKKTLQLNTSTSFHTDSRTPGYVLPAGGTFEFLLNHALLKHAHRFTGSHNTNMSVPAVSQLLANALLSVPRQIYSYSPRHFLQTKTKLLSSILNLSHPCIPQYEQEHKAFLIQGRGEGGSPLVEDKQNMHCCREAEVSTKVSMLDSGLESVSCKYQLLVAVLQCVSSLLRVDTVLHVHTALRTQSRRLANISWEGAEEEAED